MKRLRYPGTEWRGCRGEFKFRMEECAAAKCSLSEQLNWIRIRSTGEENEKEFIKSPGACTEYISFFFNQSFIMSTLLILLNSC